MFIEDYLTSLEPKALRAITWAEVQLTIHLVGKAKETNSGVAVRLSACGAIDERIGILTLDPQEVSCKTCRKRGMYKHRLARLLGVASPCRPNLQKLYDDLFILSDEGQKVA